MKAAKTVQVTLPVLIELRDYHEIAATQDILRAIIRGIKVRELGHLGDLYVSIAYVGRLTDTDNAALIKKTLAEIREQDIGVNEELTIGVVR